MTQPELGVILNAIYRINEKNARLSVVAVLNDGFLSLTLPN